jgi:hypothetical protein
LQVNFALAAFELSEDDFRVYMQKARKQIQASNIRGRGQFKKLPCVDVPHDDAAGALRDEHTSVERIK